MPDFGIFRGFNEKLFGDKLYAGQLPTQLGSIGSGDFGYLYLLNDYPNAAAAYSLRKLRSAYTGDAIRVRRASDNTEQDIGFFVNNELDTSTLTSFCSGTDGFVKTWYDQSGNGYDATQTTAANQPQIVSSGSVILENGKPALDFDGTNDYMTTNYNTNAGDDYYLSVVLNTNITRNNYIVSSTIGFSGGVTFIENNDIAHWTSVEYASELDLPNNWGSTQFQQIISVNKSGADVNLYAQNNNYIKTLSNPSSAVLSINYISTIVNNRQFETNIQELIVYPSDQSSNRTGIETNINDFYSIY